jgi:hypothetical protein
MFSMFLYCMVSKCMPCLQYIPTCITIRSVIMVTVTTEYLELINRYHNLTFRMSRVGSWPSVNLHYLNGSLWAATMCVRSHDPN